MSCLARKSADQKREQQVLKQLNKLGGPHVVGALLAEYNLIAGTDLLSTSCLSVEDGAAHPSTGAKRALVCGLNYRGGRYPLHGCIVDATNISHWLRAQGFTVTVLTDDTPTRPTRSNMLAAMRALVQGAREGDALFFAYSGHGASITANAEDEADGKTETLVPLDAVHARDFIQDNEVWGTLVAPLPAGVALHCVLDCCHSGTGMDLPFEYKGEGAACWKEAHARNASHADVVAFSGCEDDQTSADLGAKGGALTNAFLEGVQRPGATFKSVYDHIHAWMNKGRLTQEPVMSSTNTFDVDLPFSVSNVWSKASKAQEPPAAHSFSSCVIQ